MNRTTCPLCGAPGRDARRRYCTATCRDADRQDHPERLADVLRERVARLSDLVAAFEVAGYASLAGLREDRDRLAAELAAIEGRTTE